MISIIDYGINNTSELINKLEKLDIAYIKTKKESEIIASDRIIISDAQNLSKAVKRLHLLNLFSFIRILKKPVLGISLGMELLCEKFDAIACLGIFPAEILTNKKEGLLNGWHNVVCTQKNKLFAGIKDNSEFYFENNYYVEPNHSTVAAVNNNESFSAVVIKDNFYGVQFLPEKSGINGEKILKNFAALS
jgi:glutamine amidotransferase